jgi:ABC-2 type transport system permease protein
MGGLQRIRALVMQELFITRQSLEIFMDILIFPLMSVILFGLITNFIGGVQAATNASIFIMGALLWQVVSINQYNVTVSTMWSVWSHNLTNLFIAPISLREYLTAHVLAAGLRTLAVSALLALGIFWFFDFNILQLGAVNLVLFFINLSLFAWWLGIVLLGFIFRYGTRIQAIAWGVIFLFQPITAAFFPASVLSGPLQAVAYSLPATYVFEAAREALAGGGVNWRFAGIAFAMNILYFVLALLLFRQLFRRSKQTGQFARNDL